MKGRNLPDPLLGGHSLKFPQSVVNGLTANNHSGFSLILLNSL